MARLQDFQTVTPTSSDKLLVVQSQGQGLVPYGSKLDSANPTGTGKLSMNGTATGDYSVAVGQNTTATAQAAFAEGRNTTASGTYAHAEGGGTTASGNSSHAEGDTTTASGNSSHAEGQGTIAQRKSQHVFGEWNEADTGGTGVTTKGNYIEIVGKGTSTNNRSNARTLDWSGNEVLAGGLKINGSNDVIASVYSHSDWANSHTFKVAKPATYLLFTDATNDMAKLKVFPDNVATLYQMIGTNIQSVSLNTSTMEVTVAVNNKGLVAIRII